MGLYRQKKYKYVKKITLYCDNEGAIKIANNKEKRLSTDAWDRKHGDLQEGIRRLLKRFSGRYKFEHIASHQAKFIGPVDLKTHINIICDIRAGRYHSTATPDLVPRSEATVHPILGGQLKIAGKTITKKFEDNLKREAYKRDTELRLERETNSTGIFDRIDWRSMDSFLRKEKFTGRFTKCTWKLWATRKIEFLHRKARNENCRFCQVEKEPCVHVLKCGTRDILVKELIRKLGKSLEAQGGSIIMIQYITRNIIAWRENQTQILISPCRTLHEIVLNKAIEDQNILGWNLYMRGLHSEKWNECYDSWHKEKKGKQLAHKWNHYTIKLVMSFSIAIWAERCMLSKERFKDSAHDLALLNCQNMLEIIKSDPLMIMENDRKLLMISNKYLETYELSTLENWMHSVKVSCERKTLEEFE